MLDSIFKREENKELKEKIKELDDKLYKQKINEEERKWKDIPKYTKPFTCNDCNFRSRDKNKFKKFKSKNYKYYYSVYICKNCLNK